ncbi:hypothetical protein [Laceyella putida]|uniref:Uncharacterized protein n=1 Tax=Laceyella putida TaxID=110101 RepID=A0ABW2RN74_9BACL
MTQMVRLIEQLEEQLLFLLASGLQHARLEMQEIAEQATLWQEWGFPELSHHLTQLADKQGPEQITQLFLLLRQCDWLKRQFIQLDSYDPPKKRQCKKNSKWSLYPLSLMTMNETSYIIVHLWEQQKKKEEGVLIWIPESCFPTPIRPRLLRSVFEVEDCQFDHYFALDKSTHLPVFRVKVTNELDVEADELVRSLSGRMCLKLARGAVYLDRLKESDKTRRWTLFNNTSRMNMKQLEQIWPAYCFYYKTEQFFIPLIFANQLDLKQAVILHVYESAWTDEQLSVFKQER